MESRPFLIEVAFGFVSISFGKADHPWNCPLTPSPTPTDNTAAIQALLTHLTDNGGGVLRVGRGAYQLSAPLTIPKNVRVVAESRAAQFEWGTDLGSGVAAVSTDPSAAPAEAPVIENLMLLGPGASSSSPASMDGFAPASCVDLIECQAQYFRAGCVIRYDHNAFVRCRFTDNYYNVYFGDSPTSKSNHQFYGCWLDGPYFASVAVAGDNIIDSSNFVGGHVGFGPYGFYKFDGPSGPSALGLVQGTRLDELSFEAIGNAAILDESTGGGPGEDSMTGVEISNPGFIWDPTYKIPSRPADWAVNVRLVQNSRVFGGTYPFTSGDVGVLSCTTAGRSSDFDCGLGGLPANLFGSGTTWCMSAFDAIIRDGNNWFARPYINNGPAVNAGQLLEYNGAWFTVQPYGLVTQQYAGIALNNTPAGGIVVVAQSGQVFALSTPIGIGQPLYPDVGGGAYLNGTPNGEAVATSVGEASVGPSPVMVWLR